MMLAQKMAIRFDHKAAALGLKPSTTLNGLNAYQLITAASIVEKEGYYPVNMPKVARVIFNRLRRGGPLQMDATVLYYLHKDGGTVTRKCCRHPSRTTRTSIWASRRHRSCTISKFSITPCCTRRPATWIYFT